MKRHILDDDPSLSLMWIRDHAQRGGSFAPHLLLMAKELSSSRSRQACVALHDALISMVPNMPATLLSENFFEDILLPSLDGIRNRPAGSLEASGATAQLDVAVAVIKRSTESAEFLSERPTLLKKVLTAAVDCWRRYLPPPEEPMRWASNAAVACAETVCDLVKVIALSGVGIVQVRDILQAAGAHRSFRGPPAGWLSDSLSLSESAGGLGSQLGRLLAFEQIRATS